MRAGIVFALAGLAGLAALGLGAASPAGAGYRDPVGDARRGGDIESVAMSERGGTVEVVVRFAAPLPDGHLVAVYVDSDRTAETGVEHRYRGDPPAGTDFWMWGSGGGRGNALWTGHDHNAATDDPLEPVVGLWRTKVAPRTARLTFTRAALASPPEGFGRLRADRGIRLAVRSFQLMGVIHDRSPDAGWHRYTVLPPA